MDFGTHQLKTLDPPIPVADAKGLLIKAHFTDGNSINLAMPTEEIGDLFGYVAMLNQILSDQGVIGTHPEDHIIGPIRSNGLGFRAGDTASDTQLVLTLSACSVAFGIANSDLVKLADEISQIARTLSADTTTPS